MLMQRRTFLIGLTGAFASTLYAPASAVNLSEASPPISALARVGYRRTMDIIHEFAADLYSGIAVDAPLMYSIEVRTKVRAAFNYYLSTMKMRETLFDFRVVCNESNNPPDIVDSGDLLTSLYLKLTPSLLINAHYSFLPENNPGTNA